MKSLSVIECPNCLMEKTVRRALGGYGPFYVGTVSQTVRSGNGPYIKIVIQHVNSHSSRK